VVSHAGSHNSSLFPDFIPQISVLFDSPFGQEKIRTGKNGMME
jgi:hypothetical protein